MWKRITQVAGTLLLGLSVPTLAQSELPIAHEPVVIDLGRSMAFWPTAEDLALEPGLLGADEDLEAVLVARASASRLVGERRLRDLQTAHFHLQRRELAPSTFDSDHADEESERILLSCVGKLARKDLERRSGFSDWLDRLDAKRLATPGERIADEGEQGWSWRVSPRFRLGSRDTVGVRLRPKHPDHPWVSRFHVGLRHDLDDGTTALRAGYTEGSRYLRLELHPDSEEHGDRLALSGGWRF